MMTTRIERVVWTVPEAAPDPLDNAIPSLGLESVCEPFIFAVRRRARGEEIAT
jgi:hypothetical protein